MDSMNTRRTSGESATMGASRYGNTSKITPPKQLRMDVEELSKHSPGARSRSDDAGITLEEEKEEGQKCGGSDKKGKRRKVNQACVYCRRSVGESRPRSMLLKKLD